MIVCLIKHISHFDDGWFWPSRMKLNLPWNKVNFTTRWRSQNVDVFAKKRLYIRDSIAIILGILWYNLLWSTFGIAINWGIHTKKMVIYPIYPLPTGHEELEKMTINRTGVWTTPFSGTHCFNLSFKGTRKARTFCWSSGQHLKYETYAISHSAQSSFAVTDISLWSSVWFLESSPFATVTLW